MTATASSWAKLALTARNTSMTLPSATSFASSAATTDEAVTYGVLQDGKLIT